MVVPVNSAHVRVGRLLEIRADAGYRAALDVDVLFEAIVRETAILAPGTRHVTIVDWRNCPIMSPEAAERMGFHLRGRNTHHILEGTFKASARALRQAVERNSRILGVPSTKGSL